MHVWGQRGRERVFVGIPNSLIAGVAFIGKICKVIMIFPLDFIGTKLLLLYCKECSAVNC